MEVITFIVNLFQSLLIAIECNELANSGDYDAIRKILEIERVA